MTEFDAHAEIEHLKELCRVQARALDEVNNVLKAMQPGLGENVQANVVRQLQHLQGAIELVDLTSQRE